MKKTIHIIFLLIFIWPAVLAPVTFEYTPENDESGFLIDAPADWERYSQSDGKSGSMLFYDSNSEKDVYIEVRSIRLDSDYTLRELMHLVTARLAMRFYFVEMITEGKAQFRPDVYAATWNISEKNKTFKARTAFILQDRHAVIVFCIAPPKDFARHAVTFENAIQSFRFPGNR
ncbi:MAG: hypothetical protein KDK41_08820 [Leptospiraceae bacterium]|nr:hypothetical protein [Leptospiraceae bacterium]